MTEVQKAYGLNAKQKVVALQLYKAAIVELANNYGTWECDDAHTQLSAYFGVKWLAYMGCATLYDKHNYEQANNAFNYANVVLGISGRFCKTAEDVLGESYKKHTQWVEDKAEEMDYLLTFV